jgi:hypothetical protein
MKYGKDPNVRTPKRTWELTLSEAERILINSLGDFILPIPTGYLQPSEINIAVFFDEWISAPYVDQQNDSAILLKGLKEVELESQLKYGVSFYDLLPLQKKSVLDDIISSTDGINFFYKFRYLLLGGYYTSDPGFNAIGYIGNIPLNHFPAPSMEAQQMIKTELTRLGLPSDI